ncbi:helix-turn-helix domain-containing protein [Burkholderia glumae]|uniref:helix-turn-helix domain-containing protein n=2 Tax=Burkholderia glumae TaxID=337 RepID=UPI0002F8E3A6|nr:helix-turn-helix domain-containing protein [Burkholderia glumae]MCM2483274.1 helix-turn-helix domain-containing protein [Burkholderia glumae]MCM2506591.1 helix-turn-helix domain-containing protein [Burkholderia glumae]
MTLNMRELDRLKVIRAVVDMGLKPGRAAERLGVTVRQVQRLVERYRESGAAGLVSHKRGRPGIAELEATVQLLTASHLAMLRAVGELGGFSKWAKFYEQYREARDKLAELGAMPTAPVSAMPAKEPKRSGETRRR